jgi:RNA polymerase sigma factor (sigma-70 family)
MRQIEEQLMRELDKFTAFVRGRVGDPHLAADVVQDSLLKAVKAAGQLRDEENVVAWFYRILRRSIIDLHRRRAVSQRMLDQLEHELSAPPDAEEERTACVCVAGILPTLKPDYAELIRQLDLDQQAAEKVGADLGLTANNLRVRHHRARQQLRERLEQTCRMCATHGCLDCTCQE